MNKLPHVKFPYVQQTMSDRSGELLYKDKDRFVSVYIEMSGTLEYIFLVSLDSLKDQKWSNGEPVSASDFELIKSAFKAWAEENKIKCQW